MTSKGSSNGSSRKRSAAGGCSAAARRGRSASRRWPTSRRAGRTSRRAAATRPRSRSAIVEGRDRLEPSTSPTGPPTSTRTARRSSRFQNKNGTKIKYVEEINDNDQFFGKVRQQYAQGDSGGRDLHVVTDWMAARMKRLGYVQKFDKSSMPNANANLIDRLKSSGVRPQPRVLDALAVGDDRDHLPQGQGQEPAQVRRRPVRPRLQGQGHDAHRDARHGRARHRLAGRRPREGHASTST